MKTKTQKDIKREVIKENIFKALHIVGYASIGILALLGIVMGVQSCKRDDHQNNDSQQRLKIDKGPQYIKKENGIYYLTASDFNDIDKMLELSEWAIDNGYTSSSNMYPAFFTNVEYYRGSNRFFYSHNANYGLYGFQNTDYKAVGFRSSSSYNFEITIRDVSDANGGKVLTTTGSYNGESFVTGRTNVQFAKVGSVNTELTAILESWVVNPNAYQEGYETGVSEGYESGYSEGYEVGYSEGQENATPSEGPQNETIYLNGYDYRGWFGNVDTETGLIQYQVSQATYYTYGGVEWKNKGNGRVYNFVSMIVQPVEQNLVFAIGKEMEYDANTTFYNGRTGEQLYGSDYNKFSFISRIYYGYKEGYNGGEIESGSWNYRDNIYEMPMVSCRNTEASYVSGWLSHDYNIAPLYRSMEIIQDSGTKFNTPKYNDVSIIELWKMDLNNYIGVSNPATEVNVFTMLSKAFNSITSVLSIEVLPHMTLGLFLFVPLVVGIVFAVIKVIKK